MRHVSSQRTIVLSLAAILCIYSGALSPIAFALQIHPRLGGMVRGGLALLALPLLVVGFCLNGRLRFPAMALFGLLPYVYLVGTALTQSHLEGAYSYLYKCAPYLCAGVVWWLLYRIRDRALFWLLVSLGAFVSLRALFVFLFPTLAPQRDPLSDDADGFLVYELVGALPRVFYPGMAVIFLGLAVSLRGVIRERGGQQAASAAFLVLGSLGLLVTMTRGLLIIGAFLLFLQALWILNDARLSANRKLNFALIALSVGGTVLAVALAGGLGSRLLGGVADVASSDRLTLDDRNLVWREKQADAAFSLMKSDRDWLVGMGTTASVPLAHGTLNELHLGYHTVLWTFGLLGLTILLTMVGQAVLGGWYGPRARPYWREMWIAVVFVAANGVYIPTFTLADFGIVLVIATAYVWLPHPVRSEAETEVGPAGATWRPRPQAGLAHTPPRRRWSQMVGEPHGPR